MLLERKFELQWDDLLILFECVKQFEEKLVDFFRGFRDEFTH